LASLTYFNFITLAGITVRGFVMVI